MRISHSLPGLALATLIASYATAALAEPPPPPPPPPDEPPHAGAHHHKHKSDPDAHHKKGHADHEKGEHESAYPLSYTERPLTLPKTTLAPELAFNVGHIKGASKVEAGMNLGATFGITNDFEIGANFLPLSFSPEFGYGSYLEPESNLQFFATYRFMHSHTVEIGGRMRVFVITPHTGISAGAVIQPSVPFLFHFGKTARLDVELGVPIYVNGVSGSGLGLAQKTFVGLNVPVAFSIDIAEPFHVGLRTGFIDSDFGDFGHAVTVPLGFFAGYAVGGKKPVVDIDPYFTWGKFLTPGVGAGGEKINPGDWTVGLNVRAYIYL